MSSLPIYLSDGAPLAPLTTLGVGGQARLVADTLTRDDLRGALDHAERHALPLFVLGGGSNVVIADAGFDGMVVRVCDYRLELEPLGDGRVRVLVGAGVEWDELVAFCVAERLAGIECLSGIPGKAGAAPIQNIGAYGQEVSETIEAVHVVDRATSVPMRLPAEACGFGYRHSRFKDDWRERFVVVQVDFVLRRDGAPQVRYDELRRALRMTDEGPAPSLEDVRTMVLRIRRRKSMVIDTTDPNHRSVGSFFVNPIVDVDTAERVRQVVDAPAEHPPMPAWPVEDDRVKLSAAWLIERAGFERGFAFGRAGLSSRHTLAIINRGGATARDIIALAALIRRTVDHTFGVALRPEPGFVGFDADVDELLGGRHDA